MNPLTLGLTAMLVSSCAERNPGVIYPVGQQVIEENKTPAAEPASESPVTIKKDNPLTCDELSALVVPEYSQMISSLPPDVLSELLAGAGQDEPLISDVGMSYSLPLENCPGQARVSYNVTGDRASYHVSVAVSSEHPETVLRLWFERRVMEEGLKGLDLSINSSGCGTRQVATIGKNAPCNTYSLGSINGINGLGAEMGELYGGRNTPDTLANNDDDPPPPPGRPEGPWPKRPRQPKRPEGPWFEPPNPAPPKRPGGLLSPVPPILREE